MRHHDHTPPVSATRGLPPVVRRFLDTEASGGIVLVLAAIVALVWANSPWRDSYESLWHTEVALEVGALGVREDLRHFVNDGLMALFFLVVGLEIKRELVAGDLRDRRVAALPAVAALGGMVLPAGLYLAINAGAAGGNGWGIPIATDIAFAVGVLALLGPRVPPPLKLFLLSLAIVDDIGAIVVIAFFYSADLHFDALGLAVAAAVGVVVLRALRVRWTMAYVALGVACWLATFESGVHPTLAGVVLGLLAPARPLAPAAVARRWALDLSDDPTATEIRHMSALASESVSPVERLEHVLHPVTSFVIVPVFALANAGLELNMNALDAPGSVGVAIGVVVGLVVGKLAGVSLAAWLAVRTRIAVLPPGVTWRQVAGVGAIAGIGFTVSLFIAGLAFDRAELEAAAKLAVLIASVMASLVGVVILWRESDHPPCREPSGDGDVAV